MATTATTTRKAAATKRSTTAKKAAATRSRNQAAQARRRSAAAAKAAATRAENTKTPLDKAVEYAEKAVLVPVGAVLVARDNVVSTVEDIRTNYSTPEKAQRELRRFERRGTTARNRVEREVRKTRTRVERELRQRRTRAQRVLKSRRTRVERELKLRQKDLDLAQARVENFLQTGITTTTELSTESQKEIAAVAYPIRSVLASLPRVIPLLPRREPPSGGSRS